MMLSVPSCSSVYDGEFDLWYIYRGYVMQLLATVYIAFILRDLQ
jgi:hypothetical protein